MVNDLDLEESGERIKGRLKDLFWWLGCRYSTIDTNAQEEEKEKMKRLFCLKTSTSLHTLLTRFYKLLAS